MCRNNSKSKIENNLCEQLFELYWFMRVYNI